MAPSTSITLNLGAPAFCPSCFWEGELGSAKVDPDSLITCPMCDTPVCNGYRCALCGKADTGDVLCGICETCERERDYGSEGPI